MNDLAIARAIHVLAVVVWIGGVTMVTTVILPVVRRRAGMPMLLEAVERRFIWQARIATLLAAASGFYMVERLNLWERFQKIDFWWMHAMVLVWLIFTFMLFVGEPLVARRHGDRRSQAVSGRRLVWVQWFHWVLLLLSAITVLAAVAGSQGMSLVP